MSFEWWPMRFEPLWLQVLVAPAWILLCAAAAGGLLTLWVGILAGLWQIVKDMRGPADKEPTHDTRETPNERDDDDERDSPKWAAGMIKKLEDRNFERINDPRKRVGPADKEPTECFCDCCQQDLPPEYCLRRPLR